MALIQKEDQKINVPAENRAGLHVSPAHIQFQGNLPSREASPNSQSQESARMIGEKDHTTSQHRPVGMAPALEPSNAQPTTPTFRGRRRQAVLGGKLSPASKRNISGDTFGTNSKTSSIRDNSPTPSSRQSHWYSLGHKKTSAPSSGLITPEINAMLHGQKIPDLASVNDALERLRQNPNESKRKACYITDLTILARELDAEPQECRTLLKEAMKERSLGHHEICRGKCVQIIHMAFAPIETKVYAYNILATQTTIQRARSHLETSEKLVRENMQENPEMQRLLNTIAVLRQSVKRREIHSRTDHAIETKDEDAVRCEDAITPVSAEILGWARDS